MDGDIPYTKIYIKSNMDVTKCKYIKPNKEDEPCLYRYKWHYSMPIKTPSSTKTQLN
ncbi:hypothetical protein Hanom_Chr17g01554451 [Helianthus anomalus]